MRIQPKILPILVIAFCLMLPRPLNSAPVDEYRVKALFILKVCKLSDWPKDAAGPGLCIAVLGRVPSTAFESTLRSQSMHGAPVSVRQISEAEEAKGCHVLYIAPSERHRLSGILRRLKQASILTVSDIEDFCESGGMIGMVTGQSRIAFEVNLAAIRKTRLTVDARLLQLASYVYGK